MLSINRELTFLPVGSLREDQAQIGTFMRGWDSGIARVPLIFHLLLPYLICVLLSRIKGREFS